jgi:hypothetical protein
MLREKMPEKRMGKPEAARSLVTADMVAQFRNRIENPPSLLSDSELLIELLNGDKLSGAGRGRATRILEILQTRQYYMPRLLRGEFRGHFEPLVEVLLNDALELNQLLSRYQIAPQIDPIGISPKIYFFAPRQTNGEDAERATVMSVLELAERNELASVGSCRCGRFFLARRSDQRHCSANCRVKEHQSSEEFKAERRKRDRERYQYLHRGGKVKEGKGEKHVTQKAR